MGLKLIQDEFPAVYEKFFPTFFRLPIPEEAFSSCADCPMLCKDENRNHEMAQQPFSPDTKCCTYHPKLPNYLIGALLADKDPSLEEGRKRIRQRIKDKAGVNPAGIIPYGIYNILYNGGGSAAFGNSKKLVCPYFKSETGQCTIWKFRDAVCSTYFCKHVSSRIGKTFWDSVKVYLTLTQNSLVKYTLLGMKVSNVTDVLKIYDSAWADKTTLTAADIDNEPPSESDYGKIWGNFIGREEEFYIGCFNFVNNISNEKFNSITGIQQAISLINMNNLRKDMMHIPNALMRNDELVFKADDEMNYLIKLPIISMSLSLPSVVIDSFDGVLTVQEVKQKLADEHSIELDDEIILTLYTNSVLVN